MGKSNKKEPKLRFPQCTKPWEERKVSELFTSVESGNRLPKVMICKGNIPYVVASNDNNGIIDYISINQKDYNGNRMKLFPENSITFSIDNPEAIFVQKTPFFTSNIMRVLHDDKYNNYHIIFFSELIKGLTSYYNWSFKFSGPVVMNSSVFVPVKTNGDVDLEEIEKIGSLISKINDLITLHQDKINGIKQYKQAILSKMFPKEGTVVPQIRFPGFNDPWKQCKLGDIISKLTGGVSIAPNDYVAEGYRTIPKSAINDLGVANLSGCKFVSEDFYKKNISSKTVTNELVTSLRDLVPSAPNMGRIVRIRGDSEEFLMPQGVYSIVLNSDYDEDFLIAYSNSPEYRKRIKAEKNGSTQVHIRNGEFLNIYIPVPSYEEQKRIGTTIKNLDSLIILHQHKRNQLKEYKNNLLKQILI